MVNYYKYMAGQGVIEDAKAVPVEVPLTFYINGNQWVTLMATPTKLNFLAIGFLYTSGIIGSLDDLLYLRVCEEDSVIEVMLTIPEQDLVQLLSKPRSITSGCGGGVSFAILDEYSTPISQSKLRPEDVISVMHNLHLASETYRETGGIHTCALSQKDDLLVVAEDVGRHNAVDKIVGESLWKGIDVRDKWLISSGRISSEMALKAARLGCPVIISHTSPTSLAIEVCNRIGITLIGYARGNKFNIYSGFDNLILEEKYLEKRGAVG